MANTYVRQLFHCVWSTKHRQMVINQQWEMELWAYMGGIARKHEIHPIQIGGIENHIHALVEPPKNMHLPTLLEILKSPSSKWINQSSRVAEKFHWQDGYGAFSVSPSMVPRIVRYIQNQREHHRIAAFEDEYRELLRSHAIDFEETYLFG